MSVVNAQTVSLTLTPSTVNYQGNVIPSVSCYNCYNKLAYFKQNSCLGPGSSNLITSYTFDENSGTTVHDYSNNINGNINNANWIAGKFGSALNFGGSNNYVNLGTSSSLNFGPGQDFSISAWIKSNRISSLDEWDHVIVSIGWGEEDANGDEIIQDGEKARATLEIAGTKFEKAGRKDTTGRLLFFANRQWDVTEDCMFSRIDDGKWHHVVAVADRDGNAVIYLDNIQVGQKDISQYYNTPYGLIGDDVIGGLGIQGSFSGTIDEVRIYNKALIPEEVDALYNERACKIITGIGCTADKFTAPINSGQNTYYACVDKNTDYRYDSSEQGSGVLTVSEVSLSGLVGYWELDEGSGIYITDSSGNGKIGVIIEPLDAIWTKECNHKNCLYFNGNGGYVDIPNSWSFTQITLEASIYPLDCGRLDKTDNLHSSSTPLTVGVGEYQKNAYFEYRNDCTFEFNLYDSSGSWKSIGTVLIPNLWYHVIGTFDGTNQRLYVNGQLVASGTSNGMILDNTNIRIGTDIPDSPTYVGNFIGKIDEVEIYNRALTPAEISQYYNYPFIYPIGLPYDPESRTTLPIVTKFEQKNLLPFYLKRAYDWPFGLWGDTPYYPIARGTVNFDEEGMIFNSCGHMWSIARSDYLEQVNVSWLWKPLDGTQFINEAWINKKATGSEALAPGVSPSNGIGLTCMIFFEPSGIYYSKTDQTYWKVQLSTKDLTKSNDWVYVNAIVDYRDSVKKIKSLTIKTTGFSQTWTNLPIGYEPTGGESSWFQPQVYLIDSGSIKVKQISINQITTTTTTIRPSYGGGCPTLFTYDGKEYVKERKTNIHSQEGIDTVDDIVLSTKPAFVDGNYLLQLKETTLPEHSYIDTVKLFVTDSEGKKEAELISAEHSKYGDVTANLKDSDDVRTDTKVFDNIELKFKVPELKGEAKFMFEIEGYNPAVDITDLKGITGLMTRGLQRYKLDIADFTIIALIVTITSIGAIFFVFKIFNKKIKKRMVGQSS